MLRIILKIKMILLNFNEVFYINGSDTLPPPLSKAEEQSVMKRISDGDDSARELLIVHNLRLVVYIAKKFESPSAGTEDLISIGTIGLIKAVNTFSPEKNIKLATYASRCIENEILMTFRKEKKLVKTVSMEEAVGTDKEGNELPIADLVCTEDDSIFEQVQRKLDFEQVDRVMQRVLSKRERTVIALRFGLNGGIPMAQREVANVLSISRSYVSRIESKAMEKLRSELKQMKTP